MKRVFTFSCLVALCYLFPMAISAQECIDYHKTNCKPTQSIAGSVYTYCDDSRSALMLKGQQSEFRFQLHQGKDFRITICSDAALGDKIQYQIIDWDENTLLYDNKDYNFERSFEFTVLRTRNVKIVVDIPADSKTTSANTLGFKAKPTQMGCVGVLIESMVTPKKGF